MRGRRRLGGGGRRGRRRRADPHGLRRAIQFFRAVVGRPLAPSIEGTVAGSPAAVPLRDDGRLADHGERQSGLRGFAGGGTDGPPPVRRKTPGFREGEAAVAAIWEEVLGVGVRSKQDDFFTLGGHSLAVLRVLSLLRDRAGVELHATAVLRRSHGPGDGARRRAGGTGLT